MYAPEIDIYISNRRHEEKIGLDKPSENKLYELFELLAYFNTTGNDNRYDLWISAPCGKVDDSYDFDSMFADGFISSREELQREFQLNYPDAETWYHLVTLQYKEYRSVYLNGFSVIEYFPETKYQERNIEVLLDWMISETKKAIELTEAGEYNRYVENTLPLKYRYGTIDRKTYEKILPDEKDVLFEQLSDDDISDFIKYVEEQKELYGDYPEDKKEIDKLCIKDLTVEKYINICSIGYRHLYSGEVTNFTALEMYKKYADDRNGGLLTLDFNSAKAFREWYDVPTSEKWKIENSSHSWEIIAGSSRTRMYLTPHKHGDAFYLTLHGPKYCVQWEIIKCYVALRRKDIPVFLYDANAYYTLISKSGHVGIVPCYHFTGSFVCGAFPSSLPVYKFVHLIDKEKEEMYPNEEFAKSITWLPLKGFPVTKKEKNDK